MTGDVTQVTKELRSIVQEADPDFDKGSRYVEEYKFTTRLFRADYTLRGPYDPIQNVEDGLQDTSSDQWPNYDSYDYFGGPNA